MNIAIVNDLDIEIEALRRLIEKINGYNIIWVAKNGIEAIEKNNQLKPDLILMNLNMPFCDGVEATKRIMSSNPTPIIIISTSVHLYQSKIFEAMGYGALDISSVPTINDFDENNQPDLLKKIDMIAKLSGKQGVEVQFKPSSIKSKKTILIGASTGGPKVISNILETLPSKIDGKIIIVQHLDKQFTQGMIEWLSNYTNIPIIIAEHGLRINDNFIYLVGGNEHYKINHNWQFEIVENAIGQHYVPSINILFQSFAENYENNGLAFILTGMGSDGAHGLMSLKKKGWKTFAQDEYSSVVYGMPKAAYEIGATQKRLSVEEIIFEMKNYLNNGE